MMTFLGTIARPGIEPAAFSDDTNLIDKGVIDSLALIQIISYLEQNHSLNLQTAGMDPNDLGSVASILGAIERART